MVSCVCPGAMQSKARHRRWSKVLRIQIPEHREAAGARLEADGKGEGFFFRFYVTGCLLVTPVPQLPGAPWT